MLPAHLSFASSLLVQLNLGGPILHLANHENEADLWYEIGQNASNSQIQLLHTFFLVKENF